jgi:hypothetical protein
MGCLSLPTQIYRPPKAAKKDFATTLATIVIFVVFVSKSVYNNVQVTLYFGGGPDFMSYTYIFLAAGHF